MLFPGIASGGKLASSSSLWTPAEISTDLWLDPDDAATIQESGGDVTDWDDKSGNLNHAQQLTASYQFKTGTRTLNGKNGMDCSGSYMDFPEISANNKSIFAVVAPDTDTAIQMILSNNGTSKNRQMRIENSTRYLQIAGATPYTSATDSTPEALSLSVANVVGMIPTSTLEFTVNGTLVDSLDTQGAGDFDLLRVGAFETNASFAFDGILGEVVVASTVLSQADRERLEGYLAHRWGAEGLLPGGHPYKSAAPTI